MKPNIEALVEDFTTKSLDLPMGSGVALSVYLDRAAEAGSFELITLVLLQLDPKRVHGDAMVMVLSTAQPICKHIGSPLIEAYQELYEKTIKALAEQWGWETEDVEGASFLSLR